MFLAAGPPLHGGAPGNHLPLICSREFRNIARTTVIRLIGLVLLEQNPWQLQYRDIQPIAELVVPASDAEAGQIVCAARDRSGRRRHNVLGSIATPRSL
jgi:hypothetical protein